MRTLVRVPGSVPKNQYEGCSHRETGLLEVIYCPVNVQTTKVRRLNTGKSSLGSVILGPHLVGLVVRTDRRSPLTTSDREGRTGPRTLLLRTGYFACIQCIDTPETGVGPNLDTCVLSPSLQTPITKS